MPEIKAIDLSEDIIAASLQEISDGTVLIYPTKSAAQRAMHAFQGSWQLERVSFVTMDEFKDSVIHSDRAYLQDEKRLLCLYQVLTPDDKESFHINGYEDVIEWGHHWFDFFTELCDEELAPEALKAKVENNEIYLQTWQEQYIARILEIRDSYQAFINGIGFTDQIFFYDLQHFQPNTDYQRYIFVNQYYYTALERSIIQQLEHGGAQVTVLFHGLLEWIDSQTLKSTAFDIGAVIQSQKNRLQNLNVYLLQNQDQMVLSFLSRYTPPLPESRNVLIDRRFAAEAYQSLFDPQCFDFPQAHSIVELPLFQMLLSIHAQLESLILEQGTYYMPLGQIISAISQDWFFKYYHPEWTHNQQSLLQRELSTLTGEDYLYIDLDLSLFDTDACLGRYPYLQQLLALHFHVLKQFIGITSIAELALLFDTPEGLKLSGLIPADLYQFTDIAGKFYERLANFRAIEHLRVVEDWSKVWDATPEAVATGLLKLFLQYLRTATMKLPANKGNKPGYRITSLLDTRNQSYDHAVIFHAIEGELPSSPASVWLLNETQRRDLGLKTWNDIRAWDRYYFLRLVFTTANVDIYCYQNQENDIEISSFVNELMHYTNTELSASANAFPSTLPTTTLYHSLLHPSRLPQHLSLEHAASLQDLGDDSVCDHDLKDKASFFAMPIDPIADFGDKLELRMSYSSLSAFLSNPFAWYITGLKRIRERNIEVQETTTRKFFGTVLHRFIGTILHDYIHKYPQALVPDPAFTEDTYLRTTLVSLLQDDEYRFKIPKNYNREFLFEIIIDSLVASVRWVFDDFLYQIPELQYGAVELKPEDLDPLKQRPNYKLLLGKDSNPSAVSIKIHGRADLLIETPHKKFIIDFKTGKGSTNQLMVYELFYYLLEAKAPILFEIESFICKIFEMDKEPNTFSPEQREALISKVNDQLNSILTRGYHQAAKVSDRNTLINISRADLYSGNIGGLND